MKTKNRHGRVGVKRPLRPLSEGQANKRARRARTHPWHQNEPVVKTKRGFRKRGPIVWRDEVQSMGPRRGGKNALAQQMADEVDARGETLAEVEPEHTWLNSAAAAEYIDKSVGFVKDHALELGGEKHGLRWRFDVAALDRWLEGK